SGKIPADGRYRAFLQKNERSNTVSVFETQVSDSKEIVTDFKTLERKDGLALVEAGLITGRPHQIRAHLAHLGAPIAGDSKYGNDTLNRTLGERSQLLCAYKILFNLDDESLTGPLGYLDGKIITLREVAFARRYFGAVNLP
ncbi:MAG: RNA pseudouridine synthase, partial [Oscillospiraceae bacterium]